MNGSDLKSRLAAIFAADVTGYSRLMTADARATVIALDAARSVFRAHIEANQGRVIDMAGDSVLATFGSAAGAVTAALAIQAAIGCANDGIPEERRMRFRIGVHLGDVIEKADGTVYGDGVNIAARLESLAEPGGITISDAVHGVVRGKLAAQFSDLGEQTVKNIPEPVHAFRVHVEWAVPRAAPAVPAPVVAGIDLTLPDKPSIAVLPLTNMSDEPDQEYFTDGISEDIITELSRFQTLFVIARNSSFTYKGRAVDVKQVGRELGVRYVLEGSIRRSGNRVRVTAQLIDSFNGAHVWAEKYDRELKDIFAVQEEVTECIVGAIAPQIDAAESLRSRKRPGNLSAYELAVRATALAWDGFQKTDLTARNEALRLGREALALDPESILALSTVAFVQWQHIALRTAPDREAAWKEGMEVAMRAIAIAQHNSGHLFRALLLGYAPSGGNWNDARVEAEAAYRINPQDSRVISVCGQILATAGEPEEGIRMMERSLRISPRDPFAFLTYTNLAHAHLGTRDYRKGLEWATRARNAAPDLASAHAVMATLLVGLGETDKARASFEMALKLAPEYVKPRLKLRPADQGPEIRHRYDTFLRIAAGLEDPAAAEALR